MRKLIVPLCMMLLWTIAATGQNTILQKINAIKSQSGIYYWNQYAHPNADTARINVSRWLLIEINTGREEANELLLEDILPHVKFFPIKRGDAYRMFGYINKELVASISPGGQISRSFLSSGTNDQSIDDRQEINNNFNAISVQSKKFVPDAFVKRVLWQKTFTNVYNFLKEQKLEKQIQKFGPLKAVDDYSGLNLILFDITSQEVVSMLSGITSGNTRTNLITGSSDSLENYPEDMLLVIWYIK